MHERLRQIRQRLRLSMNGVVSTSMREKGLKYKLNFGVSFPQLKAIARDFPKDMDLAEALWEQDVREMKIIATLLYPPEAFTKDRAEQWAADAPNQEIREMYAMNLLPYLPFAKELAADWIEREEDSFPLLGYMLYTRLCMNGVAFSVVEENFLLQKALNILEQESSPLREAVMRSLKQLGRQSPEQAMRILSALTEFQSADLTGKQACYDELKFEFDYYQ